MTAAAEEVDARVKLRATSVDVRVFEGSETRSR